jgi:non-ribosomal peptide synthetase component F
MTAGLLLRSTQAPPVRTLLNILDETAARHPDAPAIDDGNTALTYRTLLVAVEASRAGLAAAGVSAGDRVGIRLRSGSAELYVRILGVLAAGEAYVPVDLDDPDQRAELVFREADVAAVLSARTVACRATGGPRRRW